MKKWINCIVIAGLTAGTASAAWWPFGSDKKDQAPAAPAPVASPETPRLQRPEGMAGERQRIQLTPEQKEKMKAQHEAMMKLGEAARNETDPVKKEALIAQIRAQVTEMVEKGQAEARKRLEQAEKELPRLKAKMAEAEKNKAARIEEHVQRILAGGAAKGPEGKRPDGALKKDAKKELKKLPPPSAE